MFVDVIALARATIESPRDGAASILRLKIGRNALIEALVLVAVLSVLLSGLADLLTGGVAAGARPGIFANPLLTAVMMSAFLFGSALAVFGFGRAFGGVGDLDGALAVTVWLQSLMIAVQVLQLVVMLVLPGLAVLIGLVALGLFVWLFINFVAELHGFQSLGLVFVGSIAAVFAIGFVLTILFAILGIDLTGAMPDV